MLKISPTTNVKMIIELIKTLDKNAFCKTGYNKTTTINNNIRNTPTRIKY
tara:strand:+ start:60 stop:209 length:150 start_codon:yes stop_codon:yes gene_type:complete